MDQARLCSGVRIDSYRVVVFPRDMQPSRHAHDCGGAVRLALIAGRLVFRRIPAVRDAAPLCIERNSAVLTFGRSDHAEAPVLGDDRYPIPREVDRSRRPGRRGRLAAPAALSVETGWHRSQKGRSSNDHDNTSLQHAPRWNAVALSTSPAVTRSVHWDPTSRSHPTSGEDSSGLPCGLQAYATGSW